MRETDTAPAAPAGRGHPIRDRSDSSRCSAGGGPACAEHWAAFYRAHRRPLVAFALMLARGNQSDAEDLLQDVLVSFVRRPPEAADPLAYALSALRNRAASSARKRGGRAAPLSDSAGDALDTSAPAPDLPASTEDLVRALDALTEPQRAVVILRSRAGLTLPQTAAALGMPTGTAASHWSRALARLRAILDPECCCHAADRP